jgi:hypothetical protein
MPWWAYPLLILGMITGLAVLGFSAVRSVGTHDVQTCKCDRCQHIRTKAFLRKEARTQAEGIGDGREHALHRSDGDQLQLVVDGGAE